MSWRDHLRESIWALAAYRPFDSASPDLVRLDANESAYPLDEEELEALREEVGRLSLHRYPEVSGRPLREALAKRWKVSPDQILLGTGSDEIVAILVTAFGGGSPAKVLFPTPTFGEYESIALVHGSTPLPVPLDRRFQLDELRLLETIRRERPGLGFFASPNNPTGNRFDAGTMERIARQMDAVFVADEAYADFGRHTMTPLLGEIPGLFVMRSLSKIGLAGLRLGALLGPKEAIAQLDKVRLPFNANSASIAFACALLAHPARLDARIQRIVERRQELEAGLRLIPQLTVFPTDSNFVLVRTSGDSQPVFDGLLKRGVLIRNLSRPGPLERCLRITAGTSEENEICLRALGEVLS